MPTLRPDGLTHDQRRARRPATDKPLRRSREHRLIGGVCGGIAEFVNADPRTVRLVYLLSALPSLGFTLVGYFLLWLLIPGAPAGSTAESAEAAG